MNVDYDKGLYPTVYAGGRRSGKTTQLLKKAAISGVPVLTPNIHMKSYLQGVAKSLGLESVNVITVEELNKVRSLGLSTPKKVVIDEAQLMLETLLRVKVDEMTVTTYTLSDMEQTVCDSIEKDLEINKPFSVGDIKVVINIEDIHKRIVDEITKKIRVEKWLT